ncbi:hypothetical protein Dda_5213 [Drechslerella dactyloides]|uniref:Uncharacterized protein n=1 Tax=Drechslerella dactyloides TaxID=74499 RepID=A0AAD6IXV6_DREDA|nr:hypothetical protein Dda_5213 [Drechslerella dactyloides]
MAIEDTWYDYYRGPSTAPSLTEKLREHIPGAGVANAAPASTSAPLPPAPPAAFDLHAGSDFAAALSNDILRENERRARLRTRHGRERQLIALVLEILFQLAGFACAIVFGIWAVKSYNVSVVALKVQTVANQLSLRSMCSGDPALADDEKCKVILTKSVDDLWDANLFQNALDGTGIATPKLSLGGIIGVVIGSVAAFLFFNIIWAVWRRRRLIMQLNSHLGTDYLSNLEMAPAGGYPTAPHSFAYNRMYTSMCGSGSTKKKCGSVSSIATSQSTASTAYSGNPLTPNGSGLPNKQPGQPSHVHEIH